MAWQDCTEERPNIMMGKSRFKGTRLTVEHVLGEPGRGVPEAELLRGHPRLTPEHIRATLLYAAAVIGMEETLDPQAQRKERSIITEPSPAT